MCHDIERERDKVEMKRWPVRGRTEERQDFLKHCTANLTTVWKVSARASNRGPNTRDGYIAFLLFSHQKQLESKSSLKSSFFHLDTKRKCWLWTFEDVELKSAAHFFQQLCFWKFPIVLQRHFRKWGSFTPQSKQCSEINHNIITFVLNQCSKNREKWQR